MHLQFVVLVYTEQNIQKSSVLKHSWSKMHKSFYKVHVDFKRRLKVGTNLKLHSNFYAQQPGIFQKCAYTGWLSSDGFVKTRIEVQIVWFYMACTCANCWLRQLLTWLGRFREFSFHVTLITFCQMYFLFIQTHMQNILRALIEASKSPGVPHSVASTRLCVFLRFRYFC